jgi:hypothetical protein
MNVQKRNGPKLKAALTRAQKKGYEAVLKACTEAVREWEQWGAWPDGWSLWQRAITDAANKHTRETGKFVNAPRLEDLVKPEPAPQPDFVITYAGSIFLVRPTNGIAQAWLDENISGEHTYFGTSLVVEHRYLLNLLGGIQSAGLKFVRG